jgi:hypothetical protein
VKGQAHQQGATTSLHAFGVASGETADNTERPWGAGVPLRPRFGRQLGAIRCDPPLAAWIAQPATPPSASTHPAKATRNTARSVVKPGCGCRGRKSQPSK